MAVGVEDSVFSKEEKISSPKDKMSDRFQTPTLIMAINFIPQLRYPRANCHHINCTAYKNTNSQSALLATMDSNRIAMGYHKYWGEQSDCTPHIMSVQYCGGCSVHWRLFSTSGDNISTVGDSFSTVEVVQYSGGIASVLWGDSFSTVEVAQYSGGIISVHVGDNISTVGDNISTVEGIQYCGGIPSVLWGDNSSTCGG